MPTTKENLTQELKEYNDKIIQKMEIKIAILEIVKNLGYEQFVEVKNLLEKYEKCVNV